MFFQAEDGIRYLVRSRGLGDVYKRQLDEHSDLLVFNPFQKSALIYEGANGLRFNPKRKINLPIEISNIEPIILKNNMIENFAFTSRKQKCFGIYNFNNLGNPSLVYSINFNSYPENISISNNLLMDDHEFLISGNSFDGLSIIKILDNQLTEKKIYNKSVFQNAEFIDFNTDGIEDIIALSSINNSLHMLFRNSKNEFEDLRQIKFVEKSLSVQVFDINYDYFKDVIVSANYLNSKPPFQNWTNTFSFNYPKSQKLKNPEFLGELKSLSADLQIVVAFRMLPEAVWNMPPMGSVNLHGSLLPQYRGAAPINWAVINGEKETGDQTFICNVVRLKQHIFRKQ